MYTYCGNQLKKGPTKRDKNQKQKRTKAWDKSVGQKSKKGTKAWDKSVGQKILKRGTKAWSKSVPPKRAIHPKPKF